MADIEYFYAAHSAYAYIGSAMFLDIAKRAGRRIVHKPYDLTRGLEGVGSSSTRTRPPHVRAYYFGREIDRWSEHRNAPVMGGMPTHHRNDITLPNCLLIAASQTPDGADALSHALLEEHWLRDADLADRATLARLAGSVGLDAEALLDAAVSAPVRAQYEANTAEAIARSVFGSPTYFVDGDMFYGQDHLELVERACRQPYKGAWPPKAV